MSMITEKPSERIRFALKALREFESEENCVVKMSAFHYVDFENSKCFACFGGAAALKQFNILDRGLVEHVSTLFDLVEIFGHDLEDVRSYEFSLDCARVGNIAWMFGEMGLPYFVGGNFNRTITNYHRSKSGFYADMEDLAQDLEKAAY